ncbi:MAG TPA: hypothetical protein VGE29_13145 [Prosthecobacter sp.]
MTLARSSISPQNRAKSSFMNAPWPPPAPDIPQEFEKAVEAKENEAGVASTQTVLTPSQEEALKQQNKRTAPQLNLNPPGMGKALVVNRAQRERIEKMQQRVQAGKGKARDDFGRSAGREL